MDTGPLINVCPCRDAVMLQHQLDLASPDVQLSVVDGLLITHYPGLALAAVYDPSIGGRKPLAAPTPVAFPSKPSPEQVWPRISP